MKELILEQKVNKIIMATLLAMSYFSAGTPYYVWVVGGGMCFFVFDMVIGERQYNFMSKTFGYATETKDQILGMVRCMQKVLDVIEDAGDKVLMNKVADEILPILKKVADDAEKLVKAKWKIV